MYSNWAGNFTCRNIAAFETPTSIDDVVGIVHRHSRVLVVGSGHSFAWPTTDSGHEELDGKGSIAIVSLSKMTKVLSVNTEKMTVEVEGGITLAELTETLASLGLALENSPSLLVVTVAGALATGTHGSGAGNTILSSSLCQSFTIVDGTGAVREVSDSAMFVHLGLLGVVVRLTLRVVPEYRVQQRCYDNVPLKNLLPKISELLPR